MALGVHNASTAESFRAVKTIGGEEHHVRQRREGAVADRGAVAAPEADSEDPVKLSQEAQELQKLAARDREVRAHEAAHAAVGGANAGSPTYTFEAGPDGKRYAVGGEVSIRLQTHPGDPQATLESAQRVQAAALAPVDPSATDLRIAAKAAAMAAKARNELIQHQGNAEEGDSRATGSTAIENLANKEVVSRVSTYV